ncbi:MAG: aminoacyl-tRNA hydrolase [Bacteroidota bacterium]
MKYLIVGLGNIGADYVDTRHNIGFMVANRLAETLNVTPELQRHAYVAEGKYKGRHIHIVMPTTYMNLSGKAVRYYVEKNKLPLENLLVITDELALPFGTLRLKGKGSDGGHNGLKNIQDLLGTTKYPRLRFGIGNEFAKGQQVDYVLSDFSDAEFDALPDLLDRCVKGILSFTTIGIQRTMNDFNRKA